MNKRLIPLFPVFAPADCALYNEIRSVLTAEQPEISEHSLGFIYGYRESLGLSLSRLNDNLIIKGKYKGDNLIVSPVGRSKSLDTYLQCLDYIKRVLKNGKIGAIPKAMAMELAGINAGLKPVEDRDDFDYVYSVQELISLTGEKYHAKKNLLNNFKKRYSFEYKLLDEKLVPECLKLQEKWCNLKSCVEDPSADAEDKMVVELLNNFSNWQLFGAALVIDGNVQAFTLLEELNKNTAVGHVEKANTEYKGIYQAINQLTAENLLKKYEFVNRGQDVGEPGLRKAKLSYNPVRFAEKYYINVT